MSEFDPAVQAVQQRLLELGYAGVGEADGDLGPQTQGAILNFKNREGLLSPDVFAIDGPFLDRLQVAERIFLPPEQTQATVRDIGPKVASMRQATSAKLVAKVTTWTTVAGTLGVGVVNNLGDAINILTPVKSFLTDWLVSANPLVLVLVALGAILAVSSLLLFKNSQTQASLLAGYRDSTVRNDLPVGSKP